MKSERERPRMVSRSLVAEIGDISRHLLIFHSVMTIDTTMSPAMVHTAYTSTRPHDPEHATHTSTHDPDPKVYPENNSSSPSPSQSPTTSNSLIRHSDAPSVDPNTDIDPDPTILLSASDVLGLLPTCSLTLPSLPTVVGSATSSVRLPARSRLSTAFCARVSRMFFVRNRQKMGGRTATITAPRTSLYLNRIISIFLKVASPDA